MFIKMFIALILLPLTAVNAGTWVQVNSSTISLKGEIESEEYSKFKSVFNQNIKTIIVNSGGGETSAALQIATDLLANDVTVIVEKKCLSSCANYLFLAGKTKIIKNGIVGYHGNVTACFSGEKWAAQESEFRCQGLDDTSIRAIQLSLQAQMATEKDFLGKIGISQELFDRSCEDDKGMKDGRVYNFLLPTNETFQRYGVVNVKGQQDPKQMKKYPGLVMD